MVQWVASPDVPCKARGGKADPCGFSLPRPFALMLSPIFQRIFYGYPFLMPNLTVEFEAAVCRALNERYAEAGGGSYHIVLRRSANQTTFTRLHRSVARRENAESLARALPVQLSTTLLIIANPRDLRRLLP